MSEDKENVKAYWKEERICLELHNIEYVLLSDGIRIILTPKQGSELYGTYKKAFEAKFFEKVLELNKNYNEMR